MKILIVFAILNLVIGFALACKSCLFVSGAASATGELIEFQQREGNSGSTMYAAVVEFVDGQGRAHKIESRSSSSHPSASIGDKVEVLYEPGFPELARLNAFGNIWGVPLVFLFIGTALSITLAVLRRAERRGLLRKAGSELQ